ncbi:MAG: 3-keto-5-aminohexanoate cleavage protein [Acidimicrobiia bacterium]
MSENKINWERVQGYLDGSSTRAVLKPYGLPDITNPFTSRYADVEVLPKWDIPSEVAISVAITGGFFMTRDNPNQPISEEDIIRASRECMDAGATSLHIHVRNEQELSVVDVARFATVLEPLHDEYDDLYISAGEVAIGKDDWDEMKKVTGSGLVTGSPVNTTATFVGDTLFAKPPAVMIEKTRILQDSGVKPEIAIYTDADVDNADRYLIKSGLLEKPYFWVVLPALPGGSPMHNPDQMVLGLKRIVDSIRDIDPESIISVCAAGRPSTYLATLAMIMGLHVRVGMEDTVWRFPHRDELIGSNLEHLEAVRDIASLLGRSVMSGSRYRELLGVSS